MTGIEVAEYLNISPQFYYLLEKDKKTLTQEYLEKLSDLYGVTIDYILNRTNEETLSPSTTKIVNEVIKTDPELLEKMILAKDLSEKDREKIKEYTDMLIERRQKELEQQYKTNKE